MLHNSEDYPEPERFNLDRFITNGKLNLNVRDPTIISFGFGCRCVFLPSPPCLLLRASLESICPGRRLNNGSLSMTIASVLHTLNIHPVLGPDVKTFDPSNHNVDGVHL